MKENENSKNTCKDCKRYKPYYTKNGLSFKREGIGKCEVFQCISDDNNVCVKWESKKQK